MKCEICGKDILKDSQCIDYKYYHNDCIINLIKENRQLRESNLSMQEEMARTWKKLDKLKEIEKEHKKINGKLREENRILKSQLDFIDEQNRYIEKLEKRIDKVRKLIESDYFEDGSFENEYEVMNLLKRGGINE